MWFSDRGDLLVNPPSSTPDDQWHGKDSGPLEAELLLKNIFCQRNLEGGR